MLTDTKALKKSMGTVSLYTDTKVAKSEIDRIFSVQRASLNDTPFADYHSRKTLLSDMQALIAKNILALSDAISADFGNRARQETILTEVNGILSNLSYTKKHLRKWMNGKKNHTSIWNLPGSNQTIPTPVGVVGIMAPWNYPLNLSIVPAVAAIAAGNRVMIKMPEQAANLTLLLKRLLSSAFPENQIAVIDGDAQVAQHFSSMPFGHLLFTGSTSVGKKIMRAAAENLTPVTLELGGKSPAIVGPGFSLTEAARRIAWGRLFSAGQTCVAADYAIVPKGQEREFSNAAIAGARNMYSSINDNADYTSIIDERSIERLKSIIDDAVKHGAELLTVSPISEISSDRKFPFCVLLNPSPNCRALKEEIFGPILPVITYENLTEAIEYVNGRDTPLAAYYFGSGKGRVYALGNLKAGGMTVNDTLLHYLQDDLPFGGMGASGFGRYHGKYGFDTFSNQKSVFTQRGFGNFTGAKLIYPPYGPIARLLLKLMRKI